MKSPVRSSLLALLAGLLLIAAAAPAAQASFGIEKFFAANCNATSEKCGEGAKEPSKGEAEAEGYRQAGGHVPFGVTDFVVNHFKVGSANIPEGNIRSIRVDVAPGVVTNPEAVGKCSIKDFSGTEVGAGVFSAPSCAASSVIGENIVTVVVEPAPGVFANVPLKGTVYNLEPPTGLASDFGVALNLAPLGIPAFAHTLIEGSVEYGTDYHDYFVIRNVSKTLPIVESRLVFKGNVAGTSGFLRNPTACVSPGPETTTVLKLESYEGQVAERPFEAPVGTEGCGGLEFSPQLSLAPETTVSDLPDGLTTTVSAKHPANASENDSSDIQSTTVTLPEGMTMNPSAAAGLEGCEPGQVGIGVSNGRAFEVAPLAHVSCPDASRIGTVDLEVPTLPAGQLRGPIFLGKPAGKAIEGPPYTIYIDAEAPRYGVEVRLQGTVVPNLATGQLTTTVSEAPRAPLNSISLHFDGGAFAPIANPLVCGTKSALAAFTPYAQGKGNSLSEPPFTTEGCPSAPPPFAMQQGTAIEPATGGSTANFSFTLTRGDGNQYPSAIRTVLPAGLVGRIPIVTPCSDAQLAAIACPSSSQLGNVYAAAGAGSSPFTFAGNVFLTGPYAGAPYGLAFVVPVVAGPFNLGYEVKRAKIEVDPHTARVIVSSEFPVIRAGIPVRLKALTVVINRQGFMLTPTNCGLGADESLLASTLNNFTSAVSFIAPVGCNTLPFKPAFSATAGGKTSKANGASLEVKVVQPPGQANIRSVVTALPKQLPSRLTTLQKACLEATFAANPLSCPAESNVGTATAVTPTLPNPMTGPAYLVSHGGAAFPDLDLVLEGNGYRVILVGNTDIKKGITTTTFAANPDVPISSFVLKLPTGPHSALTNNGTLCGPKLVMPTIMTGQNGVQIKQSTVIAVTGCGVKIVRHKVSHHKAVITVQTFEAGKVSIGGASLHGVSRKLGRAGKTTFTLSLSRAGSRRHRPFRTRVRASFAPSTKGRPRSSASVRLTIR